MIYGFVSTLIFVLILPFWLIAGIFKKKLITGFKQKLGWFTSPKFEQKSIVFYGVSVGEILALENLIKKTKSEFPNYKLIITTGTQTGQEIAKKKFPNIADFITYFPFDFPFCINNFFYKTNPAIIIIAETELWPNIAYVTKKRNIPLYIVNGRISDRTYKSYKKLSFFFAPILKKYTQILTQSESDNNKLISIGARPETTKVMGNLKFDIGVNTRGNVSINKNEGDKIIIAGSTHSGEDEIILDTFTKIKKENKNIKLLIAPRHPERNTKVFELCKNTGLTCGKRSQNDDFTNNDIILLDTMGELGKMYSICYLAFIGGSFNKTGGHNPLEANIYNKPVISGPSIHNFKDIYAIITRTKAGTIVKTKEDLYTKIQKLITNREYYSQACEDCKLVFNQNRGALDTVIRELHTLLN